MTRGFCTVIAAACVFVPLAATRAAPPVATATTPTELNLDATGVVKAAPDRMVASFSAEKTAPGIASAQRAVTAMIHGASATTAPYSAITTTIGQYDVSRSGDKQENWTARQTLTLSARLSDVSALLDLTGRLQSAGLGLNGFDWQLADETRARLLHTAELKAIAELRDRAKTVATAMDMKVLRFAELSLNDEGGPRPVMMMARMATPGPSATPEEQSVSVRASAKVLLTP